MESAREIQDPITDLLARGAHLLMAGLHRQALPNFAQAWSLAQREHADLANRAAWEAARVLIHLHEPVAASEWFGRMTAPPLATAGWHASSLPTAPAERTAPPQDIGARLQSEQVNALPILEVRNLGHFQISRGGGVLPRCGARKSVSLFRYLLTRRNRAAQKDTLQDLFWPDADMQRAGHSLHVAINVLRRYLDPPDGSYLAFEHGHYAIAAEAPIVDDCYLFEQLCDEGEEYQRRREFGPAKAAFARALGCYHGDYYLEAPDLAWALPEHERLLAKYLATLDHLGQVLMVEQLYESAIECYRNLLRRDCYREDAHGQLMRCYVLTGRRGAAVRQFNECAALLKSDLGLEPMPELQELYRAITHPQAVQDSNLTREVRLA
jgi:DNA-binding SARP family transcriptional activator